MARVCKKWFPKGSYKYQKDDGFYMDDILKEQIDILIKNVIRDWDFTILITGGGEVRVGKSVLAMQIAAYWTYMIRKIHKKDVDFKVDKNIVLDGEKLIKTGNELGQDKPYSALIFDEAGADLEGKKIMSKNTQRVLDYYRECGQYNLLNILVLPDYFDLPKGIATTRSICLIDVYYTSDEDNYFERGFFNFYNRKNKKKLWMLGKKELNYKAYKYNFHGRFFDFYPIDKKQYQELKLEAMKKREIRVAPQVARQIKHRNAAWYCLKKELGWSREKIAEEMFGVTGDEIDPTLISRVIKEISLAKSDMETVKSATIMNSMS